MNRSILILGGTGFLGQKIARELKVYKQFDVTCAGKNNKRIEGLKTIKIDVLVKEKLKKILKNYDLIINCTGQITEPIYKCIRLNTEGVENIIDCIKDNNQILFHISTVSVYGESKKVNENSPLLPRTNYSISKLFSEYLIKKTLKKGQYVILRLSNLYGDINQKNGIFSYLYQSYKTDRKLIFDNNGDLSRYYLHVEDCAKIIYKLIQNPPYSGIYNIIGPEQYSIKDLVNFLKNSVKLTFKVKYLNRRPVGNIDYIFDSKIMKKINYKYEHNVEQYFKEAFK